MVITRYHVTDTHVTTPGRDQIVSTHTTRKAASKAAERRNQTYGAVRFVVRFEDVVTR